MKKLILILIAALPMAIFAGTGTKDTTKKIDISVHADKNGKVEITVQNDKDLKTLEKEIDSALYEVNRALKDVNVTIGDGKEKHQMHFKAELKIE